MPKVIADVTMSLDGYVTGPGADPEHGLGDAPETPRVGHRAGPGRHRDPRRSDGSQWRGRDGSTAVRCRRSPRLVEGHGLRRATSWDASLLYRHPLPAAGASAWSGSWVCDSRSCPIWRLRLISLGPPRR